MLRKSFVGDNVLCSLFLFSKSGNQTHFYVEGDLDKKNNIRALWIPKTVGKRFSG